MTMKNKIITLAALSLLFVCRSSYGESKRTVYFFYSRDCLECRDIKENFLPGIISKYSASIEFRFLEIMDTDNYLLMAELEKKYGSAKLPPPTMFAGDKLLDGPEEIRSGLEKAIAGLLTVKSLPVKPDKKDTGKGTPRGGTEKNEDLPKSALADRFKYLGAAMVIGAGLLDGINPCAFSTIIMFVLYLSFAGYRRIEILKVGVAFTLAVFCSYFLIGLGLMEFIRRLNILPLISDIISLAFGAAAILLGVLSLYDFYKIKKGELRDITLQLPDRIKDAIKTLVWKRSSRKYYLASAFIVGFLIGVLEFPCTGQVYVPIILALREVPSLRVNALLYLLLYNLMFIIPLITVFAFVFLGATSGGLVRALEKNSALVKFLTALLFFALGGVLIGMRL